MITKHFWLFYLQTAILSGVCDIFLYGEGTSQRAVVTCMVKVQKAIPGLFDHWSFLTVT